MLKNYLSKKFHFIVISILAFIGLLGAALSFWFTILFYVLSLIAFRKGRSSREDRDDASLPNMITSPVNGRVVGIKREGYCALFESKSQEIKIVIPWWKETGIYLPKSGEIKDISFNKGVSHFRYTQYPDSPHFTHFISLEGQQGLLIGLGLLRCLLGGKAKLKVAPGDRGKQEANIGHFPLGGTLFLYLPEKCEILVEKGDQVAVKGKAVARLK